MISNGICNPVCNISECAYDGGDCRCSSGCTRGKLKNSVCDSSCDKESCYYDYYLCGDCNSGCFNSMISNQICNSDCNNFKCEYDGGDCSNIFYYWPNAAKYKALGDSSRSSTSSNKYFQFAKDSKKVKVYILGGDFKFLKYSNQLLKDFVYKNFIIEPLYCTEENLSGCFSKDERPEYSFYMKMSFEVTTSLTLKNLIISSNHDISSYSGPSYCRYTTSKKGKLFNDRGSVISEPYLPRDTCLSNSNTNFINLNGNRLSLKVITR